MLRFSQYLLISFHSKIISMTNCLSQITLVSQNSGLTQSSVLEFVPSVTQKRCAMVSKDRKFVEGCLY